MTLVGLDHPLAQAALQEVADLHAFFEAWLSGKAENTNAVFSRVESALGEEFTMVSPSGQRLQRPDVIGWLWGTHGARASQGSFHIAIAEPEICSCDRRSSFSAMSRNKQWATSSPDANRPPCLKSQLRAGSVCDGLPCTRLGSVRTLEDHFSSPHLPKGRRDETLPCGQEGQVTSEPTPAD